MSDTIGKTIEDATALPSKYELDGERIEARPISELVAADKHLMKKKAGRNPFGCLKGVRFSTEGPGR